jgi:hypothetical protein
LSFFRRWLRRYCILGCDLLFDPEDGGSTLLRNVGRLYCTTQPDDSTLHSHCRENLRSNEEDIKICRIYIYPTFLMFKQEVLGRTNRLLSLTRHGPHWKRRVQQFFCCCVCLRYRGNVATEPLPSNDKGDKHTHTEQRDLISLFCFFLSPLSLFFSK